MKILDAKVQETDLQQPENFQVMKAYVIHMMRGVSIPHADLLCCKQHRVRALSSLECSCG